MSNPTPGPRDCITCVREKHQETIRRMTDQLRIVQAELKSLQEQLTRQTSELSELKKAHAEKREWMLYATSQALDVTWVPVEQASSKKRALDPQHP